ncbi:MAG: PorT family protein, partial [Bacteroidota bacterium]
ISSFDFGLAVGAGVQLEVGPGQIFFDVRYLLGLANLDDSEPEDEQIDVFNRGIGASVGFLFPIGQ